jgi:hypothetical protein
MQIDRSKSPSLKYNMANSLPLEWVKLAAAVKLHQLQAPKRGSERALFWPADMVNVLIRCEIKNAHQNIVYPILVDIVAINGRQSLTNLIHDGAFQPELLCGR